MPADNQNLSHPVFTILKGPGCGEATFDNNLGWIVFPAMDFVYIYNMRDDVIDAGDKTGARPTTTSYEQKIMRLFGLKEK